MKGTMLNQGKIILLFGKKYYLQEIELFWYILVDFSREKHDIIITEKQYILIVKNRLIMCDKLIS